MGCEHNHQIDIQDVQLRKAIRFVALANFAYFFVEFAVARLIGSVSLFADSVDFLEDASVNFLILMALNWSAKSRARIGMMLAVLLLWPGIATLWMAWQKFSGLVAPDAVLLSITGFGALLVNVTCAYVLLKFKNSSGSLTKAAFYSARNDAYANLAIISAGIITMFTVSGWPDLIVGLAIAAMNAGAAKEVWQAARKERAEARG
jgi:Co/Zn/Cd efflux system component